MEVTYENVKKWFDNYFKACNKNMGPMRQYRIWKNIFNAGLSVLDVYCAARYHEITGVPWRVPDDHGTPRFHEEFTPQYYVIDLKRMVVVAQFQIQFSDENTGKVWLPMQASCHYHLILDKSGDLKIKKIQYWTAAISPDVTPSAELWYKYRDQALAKKKK